MSVETRLGRIIVRGMLVTSLALVGGAIKIGEHRQIQDARDFVTNLDPNKTLNPGRVKEIVYGDIVNFQGNPDDRVFSINFADGSQLNNGRLVKADGETQEFNKDQVARFVMDNWDKMEYFYSSERDEKDFDGKTVNTTLEDVLFDVTESVTCAHHVSIEARNMKDFTAFKVDETADCLGNESGVTVYGDIIRDYSNLNKPNTVDVFKDARRDYEILGEEKAPEIVDDITKLVEGRK